MGVFFLNKSSYKCRAILVAKFLNCLKFYLSAKQKTGYKTIIRTEFDLNSTFLLFFCIIRMTLLLCQPISENLLPRPRLAEPRSSNR